LGSDRTYAMTGLSSERSYRSPTKAFISSGPAM
jgi:hypothetical protein